MQRLLIRLLTTLSTISSLSGCATIKAPDVDIGIVNAPARHVKSYNLARDYDVDGNLKPGAKPVFRPAEKIEDLNKHLCIDAADGPENAIARLKAYIKALREEYQRGCKPPAALQ